MAAIRVLQVFTSMGRGGAESMIMNYYRNIDRTKVQFDFLVHREERAAFDDEIEQMGGIIYRMPAINPINPKKYYKALRKFFKTNNTYKIVHSHLNTFSIFPLKIAQEFNISTRVAHSHTALQKLNVIDYFNYKNIGDTIKYSIKSIQKKQIHKYSTHCFACGDKAGKWLFGYNSNFKILNNAIDTKQFVYNNALSLKLKEEFGLTENLVLGHIGNFTVPKNYSFILKVFKDQLNSKPNTKLVLIGNGPLLLDIQKRAKDYHIESNILFLGLRTNISELLQMIDVFVFPSIYEGLPVTLVEAQAAGLKILASDTITEEVKLTADIQFLPITEGTKPWVQAIQELGEVQKNNNYDKIVNGNYDIISNSKEIEKFYLTQNML